MNILLLTRYSSLGASSRVRFLQFLPTLQASGIEVHLSPLLSDSYLKNLYAKQPINWLGVFTDYLKQFYLLLNARKYDLIWIEKELFPNIPAWFEQIFNGMGIRYVVDYDDAIFHNYDTSQNPIKRLLADKISKVMHGAALVVCGNDYLAERARSAGARRVEIIPSVVDLDRYTPGYSIRDDSIVVGWLGSPSTVKYLELVFPALQALAIELPIRLNVVGANFNSTGLDSAGLDVDCRPWSIESEVNEIKNFDIGIMPLADSPWERGKCGYKLIQYMACGLPVIASPVGMNREIVDNGVNGYLASESNDWLEALRKLALNGEVRRNMGVCGRKAVEQKYSLQVTAPRLIRLFHEIASEGIT